MTGRRIWSELFRRNHTAGWDMVARLGGDDHWQFESQRYDSLEPAVVLLDGDVVVTSCVYNTTGRGN